MAKCCENSKQHWQMDLGSQSIWPWWPKDDSEDEERADEPVAKKPRKKCSLKWCCLKAVLWQGIARSIPVACDMSYQMLASVQKCGEPLISGDCSWDTLENYGKPYHIFLFLQYYIYYAVIIRALFFWFLSVWRDKIWFAHLARQCNIYNLENSKNCRWVARLYGMVAKVWMTCMTVRYHLKGLTKKSNLGDLV